MFNDLPHLLTDESHWAFEAITDLVFGLIYAVPAYLAGRWGLKRHDQNKHAPIARLTEDLFDAQHEAILLIKDRLDQHDHDIARMDTK